MPLCGITNMAMRGTQTLLTGSFCLGTGRRQLRLAPWTPSASSELKFLIQMPGDREVLDAYRQAQSSLLLLASASQWGDGCHRGQSGLAGSTKCQQRTDTSPGSVVEGRVAPVVVGSVDFTEDGRCREHHRAIHVELCDCSARAPQVKILTLRKGQKKGRKPKSAALTLSGIKIKIAYKPLIFMPFWRRGWDSNPR